MNLDYTKIVDAFWPDGFSRESAPVYAILDGARDNRIVPWITDSQAQYCCLYSGTLSTALQQAAPYLVRLAPDLALFKRLLDFGWGHAWGIAVTTPANVSFIELRKHLRTLLRIQDETGRYLAFRFYDPRVLQLYLPTCTPKESTMVFGPITKFLCESLEDESLIQFTYKFPGLEFQMLPVHVTPALALNPSLETVSGAPLTGSPQSH